MHVAVLGTGIMGAAMARSLAREGHDVTVWNRTPARAQAAAGEGITACGAIADAVLGTKQPAETGNLLVLVAGAGAARAHAQPAFDAIGARTLTVGDDLGSASA